jgi:hypothetical protein
MLEMDDAIKSIKAHLYDRVVSPLFGAFLISWAIWNYRIIFVLLSSEIIPYKFNYIDEYYSSVIYFFGFSISKFWIIGIAAPLLSALLYIYLYPFFALPVYKFSLSRQKKLTDTKNEIEGATILTLEKSRKIIQDSKKMQISYDEKLHQVEGEIDTLQKIIVDLNLEVVKLNNEKNTLYKKSESSFSVDFSVVEERIKNRISNLSEGEIFVVPDAFGANGWESFSELDKSNIENIFKYHVSAKNL